MRNTNPKIEKEEKLTAKNYEQWASKYPEVKLWLPHLQKKGANAVALYKFCKYVKMTPTELLAIKAKDPSENAAEKLLDSYLAADDANLTNAFRYQASIAVKSFFKWNYHDLARASGAVTLEKVKPYNKLSKEGLRKLWSLALNPRDRALVVFVTSTGIAKETLQNLKWSHLEENWEKIDLPCINIGPELLKGHGRGKYKNVRQVTFLTPEAKRDLVVYKEWIEQKLGRKLGPDDNIWQEVKRADTDEPYKPISYSVLGRLIKHLSRRAGVDFSWHDARRYLNTALEQIGISVNWAHKIRGRKVKGEEAPYSQPAIEQLRAKFREALEFLQFTSEDTGLEQRLKRQERISKIQTKLISGEPLTKEDYEEIRTLGMQLRESGKLTEEKKKRLQKEVCKDGKHCDEDFKQIREDDLLQYLKDKWQIVKELSNGEVIVKR